MNKIALVLIGFQLISFAEGRGRVREFFRSPFQRVRNQRQPRTLNYNPIVNNQGERTIAINGIAVPGDAIGYRIKDGQISWVFRDGSESPSTARNGAENPQPKARDQSDDVHFSSSPIAPRGQTPPRPQQSDEENSPRASARPAPSADEIKKSGETRPSQDRQSASSDLFPAGTNGNPGFPYKVIGPGFFEKCQATLISNEDGLCMAATAAHCLYDGANRSTEKGIDKNKLASGTCDSGVQQRGVFWGKGQIETADFGKVEATFFVNPEYYSGTKSEDSALFSFPCSSKSNVNPVSVSLSPLKDGERVYYGKVMGGKEGLYEGTVYREPDVVKINTRNIGEAQESISQQSSVTIQQGDSGGGLYRKNAKGDFELVGVLSTGDDLTRRRPIGNYATNRSLQFIRCLQRALGKA